MPTKMALSSTTPVSASFSFRRSEPKKKMSITQTYYLAHTARTKLSKEAGRADHDLRLLVGHANLLDSLMLDLANAEKEQEQWFNNTVRNATTTKKSQPSHIRWADTIEEESVEDYSDDDSDDSDSDFSDYDEDEEEEVEFEDLTIQPATATPLLDNEEEYEEEDEEARLTLTRSPSRQQSPPPELLEDLSSDDEDSMPPSPESLTFDSFVSTQQSQHPSKRADLLTESETHSMFEEHDFIHHQGTMIPAY